MFTPCLELGLPLLKKSRTLLQQQTQTENKNQNETPKAFL